MFPSKKRLVWLDALRGFCVVLMLLYHTLYDLAALELIPYSLLKHPIINAVHWGFATLFVLISGFSCSLSRNNTKRGLRLLVLALLLSGVTALIEKAALHFLNLEVYCFIAFGILHLLAVSALLYGLFGLERRLNGNPSIGIWFCATALLSAGFATGVRTEAAFLFPFGMISEQFRSADYFPLLPWGFVFLTGAWIGTQYAAGKLRVRPRSCTLRLLPYLGRHSLAVYLLHQPIVLAGCFGISVLIRIL